MLNLPTYPFYTNASHFDYEFESVGDFTEVYPRAAIIIEGSTPSRTRWYQASINKYWNEIEPIFEVFGLYENKWEPFRKSKNYTAFMGRRKTPFLL